mmetsp:Transcript_36146/g.85574  ORF Transcript_36146/g.85574 Transcript_36146/m.85574 type:complete len:306 (+) Transcript_36146:479-1396(+)
MVHPADRLPGGRSDGDPHSDRPRLGPDYSHHCDSDAADAPPTRALVRKEHRPLLCHRRPADDKAEEGDGRAASARKRGLYPQQGELPGPGKVLRPSREVREAAQVSSLEVVLVTSHPTAGVRVRLDGDSEGALRQPGRNDHGGHAVVPRPLDHGDAFVHEDQRSTPRGADPPGDINVPHLLQHPHLLRCGRDAEAGRADASDPHAGHDLHAPPGPLHLLDFNFRVHDSAASDAAIAVVVAECQQKGFRRGRAHPRWVAGCGTGRGETPCAVRPSRRGEGECRNGRGWRRAKSGRGDPGGARTRYH